MITGLYLMGLYDTYVLGPGATEINETYIQVSLMHYESAML